MAKKKIELPTTALPLDVKQIHERAASARRKMKNAKKALQEEGKEDLHALNTELKQQNKTQKPVWKK